MKLVTEMKYWDTLLNSLLHCRVTFLPLFGKLVSPTPVRGKLSHNRNIRKPTVVGYSSPSYNTARLFFIKLRIQKNIHVNVHPTCTCKPQDGTCPGTYKISLLFSGHHHSVFKQMLRQ